MGNIINLMGIIEKMVDVVREAITASQATTAASSSVLFALIIIVMWILLVLGVGVFGTIFWIWMIADCMKRKFKKSDDRLMWLIIIAMTYFIGAAIYYFLIKKTR